MFRKILVQIDPSRPLLMAPKLALSLAERFEAQLVALYIVDEKISNMMGGDLVQTMDTALGAVGQEALEDYQASIDERVPFEKAIGYGDTADVIAKYVTRNNIDLVVTGGFHTLLYQRIPFGSVVNEIIRKTPCSVFLDRDSHPDPLRSGAVVFDHDGSLPARRALHMASAMAKMYDQTLDVVSVSGKPRDGEAVLKEVEAERERLAVPVETHMLRRRALQRSHRTLLRHAKRTKAPYIAVPRTGLHASWSGTNTLIDPLVVHTDRPLMVIQP